MKTRKSTGTLICSLAMVLMTLPAVAQVKLSKDYDKIFPASPGGKLDIANKYGAVIVRAWELDSVRISVTVDAEGRSREVAQKALDKIDVRFTEVGDVITVETMINRGSGLLKDLLVEVEGYSKSLFGSNKLTVDYEVWMPEDFELSIENKFGNVYLTSLERSVYVDLAHGDFKANELNQELTLKHSFGMSRIDYVHKGTFTLRGAEVKIEKAKMVNFESSSSEIELGKTAYAQFNSRNDKIAIEQVDEIIAVGTFTGFNAGMITESAKLDFNYGDIFITRIRRNFKSIDILGKSADINLILDQASYIKTEIRAAGDKMVVPNSMLTLKRTEDAETGIVTLAGFVGPTQNTHGELEIQADGGELIIAIKDLPLFTDKD